MSVLQKKNSPRGSKSLKRLALSAVATLALAGCMNGAGLEDIASGQTRTMAHERFPIQVVSSNEEMSVMVPSSAVSMSQEDKARVATFAASYRKLGHGQVWVSAPSGSHNASASNKAVAEISKVLVAQGLSPSQVKMTTYHSTADNAPITVKYKVYDTKTSPCGHWNENVGVTPRNGATPNFGCSTQSNLALMVEDPHDLVAPRDMTAADADRRATVISKYRNGENTGTPRTASETGSVSNVDE